LDSVFIGPAERQTLQIQFSSGDPSMFLEDLLTWIDSFASEEGPRLIQDGGKFAVGESFVPIGTQLQTLVAEAVTPANATSLPRGYRTARVRRSLEELRDQLQELVNLAVPIHHIATPEPEPAFAVLGINPTVVFLSAWPQTPAGGTGPAAAPQPARRRPARGQPASGTAQAGNFQSVLITIIGTGFERAGGSFSITDVSPSPQLQFGSATIVSDGLASAPLLATNNQLPPAGSYTLRITHLRPDGTADPADPTQVFGFTILP